jgi:NhaP-type Na+/H+ or K+/H+ antiporter
LALGIVAALLLVALRASRVGAAFADEIIGTVSQIDFVTTVAGIMLPFLLFAGAIQVDLVEMRRRLAMMNESGRRVRRSIRRRRLAERTRCRG